MGGRGSEDEAVDGIHIGIHLTSKTTNPAGDSDHRALGTIDSSISSHLADSEYSMYLVKNGLLYSDKEVTSSRDAIV